MKGSKRGAFVLVERKKFEKRWNNIEVYAAIGARTYIEDTFIVYENARGTGASFFGVFDGHGGDYAAIYARDRLMKRIINKIAAVRKLIKKTNLNQSGTPTIPEKLPPARELLHIGGINYCMTPEPRRWRKEKSEKEKKSNSIDNPDLKNYIEAEVLIDYEKLLIDVFISTDLELCVSARRRESEAGTTALVAIIEGSQLIVANVGDSRGVMCDSDGNPVPLSFDQKPDREDELKRLVRAGGKVGYNRGGCARLDAYIAMSRSLGDQKTKLDHRLIPTPEVYIFDLADHRPEFIVLATDGLYDELSSEEVVSFIRARLDEPNFGAKSLVRYAFLNKAKDNITVMVINLKGYNWPSNPRTALKNKTWKSRVLALKRPLGGIGDRVNP
ncbi:unnamed protein product [Bemisia tabaci]|uniref:PPM-type phosphatase domain-containing protein n=2 Tax=Bemisia tabaci TaxID=7038 RepID=A0A9P0AIL6_BEMTA|nr:unnamed protein product [Bemisia tabaci]